MAHVTQCDVCGNVVKHEESKYIKIHDVMVSDSLKPDFIGKDLCPACYKKIAKILDIKE